MEVINIEKEISGKKFTYSAFKNGEKLGAINGGIQNPQILWLLEYEVINKDKEAIFLKALQSRFYSDCLQNNAKIIINFNAKEKRQNGLWIPVIL